MDERPEARPALRRLLVAVDASPHSDAAVEEAVAIARAAGASITGLHAYAAQMHDARFRQMEGVLPERFRVEKELDRQRLIHDRLIGRGLDMISRAYLGPVAARCREAGVAFEERSIEGKNYRVIASEAGSGGYDLTILGFQGLGATGDGAWGTVCQRVTRRTATDLLVVKHTGGHARGPIVAGVDGSDWALGAVRTAALLAELLDRPLHIVGCYDPHFHNIAFHRISEVLSDEADKVFHLKQQEKLHGEIIDTGLGKIYQAQIDVALAIAGERKIPLHAELLEGKPYTAILDYARHVDASLLAAGKLGVHADKGLDIGGNTEHLLARAPCNVLIGASPFTPAAELVAGQTVAWTAEAEAMLARAPAFVRPMIRKAVLRRAVEQGRTIVTAEDIEALRQGHGGRG